MTLGAATLPHLSTWDMTLRLLLAVAIGSIVGLEREWHDHEAGVRTHMLVCLGAAVFTVVSAYGFAEFGPRADPTRIAAQIVTGIGFLGAGAILRVGTVVRGLTTAASLWVAAALGLAAGAGSYTLALIGATVAIVALGPVRNATSLTLGRMRSRRAKVLTVEAERIAPVIDALAGPADEVRELTIDRRGDRYRIRVRLRRIDEHLAAALAEVEGVVHVGWGR